MKVYTGNEPSLSTLNSLLKAGLKHESKFELLLCFLKDYQPNVETSEILINYFKKDSFIMDLMHQWDLLKTPHIQSLIFKSQQDHLKLYSYLKKTNTRVSVVLLNSIVREMVVKDPGSSFLFCKKNLERNQITRKTMNCLLFGSDNIHTIRALFKYLKSGPMAMKTLMLFVEKSREYNDLYLLKEIVGYLEGFDNADDLKLVQDMVFQAIKQFTEKDLQFTKTFIQSYQVSAKDFYELYFDCIDQSNKDTLLSHVVRDLLENGPEINRSEMESVLDDFMERLVIKDDTRIAFKDQVLEVFEDKVL
jgi:hypothetical protein